MEARGLQKVTTIVSKNADQNMFHFQFPEKVLTHIAFACTKFQAIQLAMILKDPSKVCLLFQSAFMKKIRPISILWKIGFSIRAK